MDSLPFTTRISGLFPPPLSKHLIEDGIGFNGIEQQHTRPELDGVAPEYLIGSSRAVIYGLRNLPQMLPEQQYSVNSNVIV